MEAAKWCRTTGKENGYTYLNQPPYINQKISPSGVRNIIILSSQLIENKLQGSAMLSEGGGFGHISPINKTKTVFLRLPSSLFSLFLGKPYLGVCLGLQCAVIEFAR